MDDRMIISKIHGEAFLVKDITIAVTGFMLALLTNFSRTACRESV